MVDGDQPQAHKTWWELRWDVVFSVLAIIAPIVFFVIDVKIEDPDWFGRSGSAMVLLAGILGYRSLTRHYQKFFNADDRGHVLTTSQKQKIIDMFTLAIAAVGTVIWGYGNLVFLWL